MAGLFGGRATPAPMPFRPLSRRSGRISALPYPPPRYSQGGRHQPRRAMIFQRTAITPLTSCLTPGVHFSYCVIDEEGTIVAEGTLATSKKGLEAVFGSIPACR